MTAVTRVTVHHEGAGAPTDNGRYAAGGYTYGIGPAGWQRFRDVASSYATLNWNHRSVDICLSGDRDVYLCGDHDIAAIGQCVADARGRGEVVDRPDVVPHRWSPGSSTVCPGTHTMERWAQIPPVCMAGGPTPQPPAPAPPPTPPAWKRDAMFVLMSTKDNRPARLIGADHNPKIGPGHLAIYRFVGYPIVLDVSGGQYDDMWSQINVGHDG